MGTTVFYKPERYVKDLKNVSDTKTKPLRNVTYPTLFHLYNRLL